jgi:hypothetical protein
MDNLPSQEPAPQIDPKPVLPEPNPVTTAKHRGEVFWQVTLPFIIGFGLFLVASVLGWIATSPEASVWADISTVFLISVLFIGFLIMTLVAAALAYLAYYMVRILPPYTRSAQDFSDLTRQYARVYADKIVEPILKIQGFTASSRALKKGLSLRRNSPKH